MIKPFLSSLLFLYSLFGFSCTTFVIHHGDELVFGRNLDWSSDNGILVVNQRNQSKTAIVFPPDKPVTWVSKYGSVSFNQFGKEFPFGGMNEKGLVVEIMVAPATYPKTDSRPALNELQWIQYQLDNAATVEEVIANDKLIRLRKVSQDLHFLIADKTGAVAVIEFQKGKMVVYKGEDLPFPVLENDRYETSLKKRQKGIKSRFNTAAKGVVEYSKKRGKSIIDYSFGILDEVALNGSWSIVYDIKESKIHFKTSSHRSLRELDMTQLEYECKPKCLVYDLQDAHSGSINSKLEGLTKELNTRKMKDAMDKGDIELGAAEKRLFYRYYESVDCA